MTEQSAIWSNAKRFLYLNGRLLDRLRYAYLFEGAPKEPVLAALHAYQNSDGGFGHGLEPDIRCPDSQPVPTEVALELLDELQVTDGPVFTGILSYLERISVAETGGFPRTLLSINDYPHAPWWTTTADDQASMNPTGRIIGLLYKLNPAGSYIEETWFRQAVSFIWKHLDRLDPVSYHDLVQGITFLQFTPDQERALPYRKLLDGWLQQPGTIEKDPYAKGYVHKVLDYVPEPTAYARSFVTDAEIEAHLQALREEQREDGGWPISWEALSPAAEMEWRGYITISRLKTLRAFA